MGGKLKDKVKINSSSTIKNTEKRLNRAERVAKGDATSSGRAATLKMFEGNVSYQNAANAGEQQAVCGAGSNYQEHPT